jgi:hypothetical protein
MKRILLIGLAASTFTLASILSASAMPSANLNVPSTISTDSSIIQVGWGHHGGRGWGHHWRHHRHW